MPLCWALPLPGRRDAGLVVHASVCVEGKAMVVLPCADLVWDAPRERATRQPSHQHGHFGRALFREVRTAIVRAVQALWATPGPLARSHGSPNPLARSHGSPNPHAPPNRSGAGERNRDAAYLAGGNAKGTLVFIVAS